MPSIASPPPVLPAWAARAPLLAGLLMALALTCGAWNWSATVRERGAIDAAQDGVLQAEGLLSAMKDVETGQRGYLLTGQDRFRTPLETGRAVISARLMALDQAAAAAGIGRPAELRRLAEAQLRWADEVLALRRSAGLDVAIQALERDGAGGAMDAAREEVARVQREAGGRAATLAAASRARAAWFHALTLALALGAALLLGALALWRRRAERRSQGLLQGIMENAPVGLGFLDRRLRLSNANRTLATMVERTLGVEAGGQVVALPEGLRGQLAPHFEAVLAGRGAQSNIEAMVTPPGRDAVRHLRMAVFPLRSGADRGVEGVGLAAIDETGRRRAEERVKRSEARLRTLVDSIPQLAWMTDPEGAIQWYNRRWHDYTGAPPEEMAGWGWRAVHHPDHVDRVVERFAAAIAAGEPWEDTFPLRRADGEYRWFLSRAVPIRDVPEEGEAEGPLIGWFGTNTDITELREAEEALVAAKGAAEDANLAKSQFIANMSHELRTPLSAVIGYAEMLEEEAGDLPGGQAILDDLGKINSNARHLLSLINDVLDISKIEAGKMEVQPEDFDAAALLREVGGTVEALVARKSNRLELDIQADLGAMHSDPVKLRQCLFNLLGNAAKFTEAGRITLGAERDAAGMVTFRVADTGIGMTREQLSKLFTRFSQADASTTRRFGGTGLGLAITRAFSAMLGGTIEVESEPGRGTVFTLRIPADLRTVRAEDTDAVAQAGAAATEEGDGPAGLVLVIDDDPATRELLARFLRREGFSVRAAVDGESGLRLARELRPSAILLDVMMPRLDGWAVLAALKADPDLADTPVVMVTVVQERGLAFSLGAADYLNKPVRWERLKQVLDRFRREPAPGLALVVESDSGQRTELLRLLEEEGWQAESARDTAAALARLEGQPPPRVLLLELRASAAAEGFSLLRELRQRPGLRDLPVIAVTEGEVDPAELEGLRRQLHGVVQAEPGFPEEIVTELRRIAAHSGTSETPGGAR